MRVSIRNCPVSVILSSLLVSLAAFCGCEGQTPQVENPRLASNSAPASTPAASSSVSPGRPAPAASSGVIPAAATAADSSEKPISDAEAQEFAKAAETAFKASDHAAINALFDYDALLKRALRGIDIDEQMQKDLIARWKTQLAGPNGYAAVEARELVDGEHERFLRVRRQGEEQRLLFRKNGKGPLTYTEFILVRDANGKPKIGDVYDYACGLLGSEATHDDLATDVAHTGQGASRLGTADREYALSSNSIQRMWNLNSAKRAKEALDIYQSLPETVKSNRNIVHFHLIACCSLDAECDDVIRAYRAAYPDDLGIDLVLLRYYDRHKKADEFLACVDRLDKVVGGDPYLDVYRATVYMYKGDLVAARKCAQNAAAAEPNAPGVLKCVDALTMAEKGAPAKSTASASKPAESPHAQPAGDEEAKTFAEKFAKSVAAADATAIRIAFDSAAVIKRKMDAANIPEENRGGIESQLVTSLEPVFVEFFGADSQAAEKKSQFRLLHVLSVNGAEHAIFRLIHASGAVNYFDATVVRNANGKLVIGDAYSFQEGTLLSAVIGRTVQLALERVAPSPHPAGEESEDPAAKLALAVTEMRQRCKDGQFQAALDIYAKLPEDLQKDKTAMILRVQAARGVQGKLNDDAAPPASSKPAPNKTASGKGKPNDDPARAPNARSAPNKTASVKETPYDEAIKAYRKEFPNEPNLDLLMIDAYLEHKLYDRALTCVDGVDKTVGGDPYLDEIRAFVYRKKGDRAAAKKCLNKLIKAEPELPLPDLDLVSISLEDKKYSDTVRFLSTIQKQFPESMPLVATDPAFADFLKSKEYKAWQQRTQKPSTGRAARPKQG